MPPVVRELDERRRYIETVLERIATGVISLGADGRIETSDFVETLERLRDVRGAADREALERMWPVLTPAELLHDLYGSRGLIELAARGKLSAEEQAAIDNFRKELVRVRRELRDVQYNLNRSVERLAGWFSSTNSASRLIAR